MRRILEGLSERIQLCDNLGQLRALRDQVQEKLRDCLLFTDPVDWYRMANNCQDWLIQHAIRLAELDVYREAGAPPAGSYAFIVLGSAGRMEQTLWSDQDNGLIYSSTDEAAKNYYRKLSITIEHALKQIGYPPCEGEVITSNEKWRMSIAEWKATLAEWFEDGAWENVRQLLIMADARVIYGDTGLLDQLRAEYLDRVSQRADIIALMLRNTLRHKVVLGPLGQLIRESYGEDAGGFDMKYGAYLPMVNAIRLLAIRHHITATSTHARLEALRSQLGHAKVDRIRGAFIHIMKLRAMTPYQLTPEGYYATRGKLRSQDLTKPVIAKLKLSLHVGEELQRYIRKLQ